MTVYDGKICYAKLGNGGYADYKQNKLNKCVKNISTYKKNDTRKKICI